MDARSSNASLNSSSSCMMTTALHRTAAYNGVHRVAPKIVFVSKAGKGGKQLTSGLAHC